MDAQVVVLGAGPAGLGAGLALGKHCLVIESADNPAGLSRTVELDGATFDLGGHSFHTPHQEIRDLVCQALPMYEQPRNAWCHTAGQWIPYPFQKHFEKLDNKQIRAECRSGLIAAKHSSQPANFREHLDRRFGAGIVRHFLGPYNQKLWGGSLERLAVDWTAERVANPVGAADKFITIGGNRTPLQDDTRVAYPERGGFGEIFQALAAKVHGLRYGQKVVGIDSSRRELLTAENYVFRWSHLVSTLPLPHLLSLLPEAPVGLREEAAKLEALPLTLLMVVVRHAVDTPVQRVYCADAASPAHKIVVNHNSSPYLRGLPQHGILGEVTNTTHRHDDDLMRNFIAHLLQIGLLSSPDAVQQTRVMHLRAAYPVPTVQARAIVQRIKDWLKDRDIDTLGRFGEWAYINSDEALYRGLQVGRLLAANL